MLSRTRPGSVNMTACGGNGESTSDGLANEGIAEVGIGGAV